MARIRGEEMTWKLAAVSLFVGLAVLWWAASQDSGSKPVSKETVDCMQRALDRGETGLDVDCSPAPPWYEERPWLACLIAGGATFVVGSLLVLVRSADRMGRKQ